MLQELDLYLFTPESVSTTRTAWRTKQQQFVDGEISLFQHTQELLSYGTTCSNNCYFHIFYV